MTHRNRTRTTRTDFLDLPSRPYATPKRQVLDYCDTGKVILQPRKLVKCPSLLSRSISVHRDQAFKLLDLYDQWARRACVALRPYRQLRERLANAERQTTSVGLMVSEETIQKVAALTRQGAFRQSATCGRNIAETSLHLTACSLAMTGLEKLTVDHLMTRYFGVRPTLSTVVSECLDLGLLAYEAAHGAITIDNQDKQERQGVSNEDSPFIARTAAA